MKTTVKRKRKQSGWRFRGITRDAERLGVTRVHLYLVLAGKRASRSLMQRYRAIQAGKEQAA